MPASSSRDAEVGIGILGCGNRGQTLMRILLTMPQVRIPAVADASPEAAKAAADAVEQSGRPRPVECSGAGESWRAVLARSDVDGVIIASPWELHTPMALAAMKAGKYAAVEVPCALSVEDCWALVDTHEATGVPCMILENWSFRRDNLAVLNMIRAGLLGKMVHCHCAHSHNCIDHWFFDEQGHERWGARYLKDFNRDQYCTHSLGPVLSWLDINCGDAFASLTSTASGSFGINAHFARKFGPDHPGARQAYAQGDIVTTVIRTQLGKTVVVNYDMQLPRPYDNRWEVQGTLGIYNEQRASVYLDGVSPQYHEWEPFEPYQQQYEHRWWKDQRASGAEMTHLGTDIIELREFVAAVACRGPTPIDIYDSVTMSVITPLSGLSIAKGSQPLEIPDFTRGHWRTRNPFFAVYAPR